MDLPDGSWQFHGWYTGMWSSSTGWIEGPWPASGKLTLHYELAQLCTERNLSTHFNLIPTHFNFIPKSAHISMGIRLDDRIGGLLRQAIMSPGEPIPFKARCMGERPPGSFSRLTHLLIMEISDVESPVFIALRHPACWEIIDDRVGCHRFAPFDPEDPTWLATLNIRVASYEISVHYAKKLPSGMSAREYADACRVLGTWVAEAAA